VHQREDRRLDVYFGQNIDGIVERLLGEQLEDGGWNCWTGHGSARPSYQATVNVLEGLSAYERASNGSADSIRAQRRGEEYLLERTCSGVRAPGKWRTRTGCGSRSRPDGATTCCVPWSTSGRRGIRRTSGWTKPWKCSDRSNSPTAPGCWRTPTPGDVYFAGRRRRPAEPVGHAAGIAGPALVRRIVLTIPCRRNTRSR
jgi:hypothetical protein